MRTSTQCTCTLLRGSTALTPKEGVRRSLTAINSDWEQEEEQAKITDEIHPELKYPWDSRIMALTWQGAYFVRTSVGAKNNIMPPVRRLLHTGAGPNAIKTFLYQLIGCSKWLNQPSSCFNRCQNVHPELRRIRDRFVHFLSSVFDNLSNEGLPGMAYFEEQILKNLPKKRKAIIRESNLVAIIKEKNRTANAVLDDIDIRKVTSKAFYEKGNNAERE